MNAMSLQREGEGWRLVLNGDWSLAGMTQIDQELNALTVPGSGTLICDWSHALHPGIGTVWALLRRLAEPGAALQIRHEGDPPHTVELLRDFRVDRRTLE